MQPSIRSIQPMKRLAPLGLLLALMACGSGDDTSLTGAVDPLTPTPGAASEEVESPVYAIGTLITSDTGSNAYLRLVDDLDLQGEQVVLDQAREFPGQSDLAVHRGSLLVASGDEPTISRYAVGPDLQLAQPDAVTRVNFGNYGLASAAFWNNQFVAADKAYMVNGPARSSCGTRRRCRSNQRSSCPTSVLETACKWSLASPIEPASSMTASST